MKVLFISNILDHIISFHIPYLMWFNKQGFEVHVLTNASGNSNELPYCHKIHNLNIDRSPYSLKNICALNKAKKIILEEKYNIIHCHTPMGGVIGRIAGAIARKKYGTQIIYTAHGFHFFKGSPIHNWFLYYPVERMLAYFTDVLITINQEDYYRANRFKTRKLYYVPGVGLDTNRFNIKKSKNSLRNELDISSDSIVLLSVGELSVRKNHSVVLEALAKIKNDPIFHQIQYLVCGTGELNNSLREKVIDLGISEHVKFLGYRKDIPEVCQCSDLFVFMSLQEGLPVALMEAMASGLPVVCSGIRGNIDLIENGVNGYIVRNVKDEVAEAILRIVKSEMTRKIMSAESKIRIQKYDLKNVDTEMQKIYLNVITELEN